METQRKTILLPAGVAESTRSTAPSEQEETDREIEPTFPSSSILCSLLTQGRDAGTSEPKTYGAGDQDLQDQDDELRALGISVVDQLSLERNVEAAVDQAVAKHSRKQRFQILKKEVKGTKMEIKQAENKLLSLKERLSGMRQRVVDPRQVFAVEKEIADKSNQLKTLRAKDKSLQQKIVSAETNEAELDNMDLEDGEILDGEDEDDATDTKEPGMSELEREKLIREGKMTPFGTVLSRDTSRTVSVPRPFHIPTERKMPAKKSVDKKHSKEDMIKSGEMTPFGTVLKTKTHDKAMSSDKVAGGMTDFEKYLKDQIDRQKQHSQTNKSSKRKKDKGDPNYGFAKKRKKKPKEFISEFDREGNDDVEGGDASKKKQGASHSKKSPKKDPIKKKVLHPKKKAVSCVGSLTSEKEADLCKRTPRHVMSEKIEFDGDGSGYDSSASEYRPSDGDESNEDWTEDEDANVEYVDEEEEEVTKYKSERKEVRRKRSRKSKSEDEWLEEDDVDEVPRPKKRVSKSRDDGNIEDYIQRIEAWKEERLLLKQAKIMRGENLDSDEEEEEGYEEFDGGFRIPLGIWNKLYKYQRTCVKWLWELHNQGCGGILGDEMGLGKTIQIISFLIGLSYSRLSCRRQPWKGLGPVLIVCPATVLHQWVKEFHKWWPPFRVAVLHESGCFAGKRPALIHNINQHDGILVTSYTGVLSQLEVLLQYNWHYLILDEGHKIRNPDAQITVAVKRFRTPHRLVLSGSPIQNSLKELWSLFDFIFPGKLGTLPVFLQQFAVPITQGGYANASKLEVQTAFKCACMLRDTINPYLLRRMKCDVRNHLNLPDKNEQVLFCDLTEAQRDVYRGYINGDQVKCILGGRMKVFVGLIALRKICNHPDLVTGGPRDYDEQAVSGFQPELKYGYWGRSGKMHVLQAILKLWSKQGHRVLLFTQSRQMMCILEKFLLDEQYSYLKMDGTTAVASRQVMIDRYNSDPSYFVFLLTTRVGGLGVNLTGADRVVIFDPDWNPSTDSQARERSWRIGQTRHVTIYRLLTAGTIEEKIYHRQIFKQFLTNRVLKDPKQQRFFKTNDLYELFSLNEGSKEKTESSALFAGTGSEIKVDANAKDGGEDSDEEGPKKGQSVPSSSKEKKRVHDYRTVKKRIDSERNSHKKASKEKKGSLSNDKEKKAPLTNDKEKKAPLTNDKERKPSSTNDREKKASLTIDKVERMKELAKLLSKKIGQKSNAQEEKNESAETKGDVKGDNESNSSNPPEIANENPPSIKTEVDGNSEDVVVVTLPNIKTEPEDTEESVTEVKVENDLEQQSTEVRDSERQSDDNVIKQENHTIAATIENSDNLETESIGTTLNSLDSKASRENMKDSEKENSSDSASGSRRLEHKDHDRHKKKHKKKDKKRDKHKSKDKSRKKGKKFEGERIDFLVKKRMYQKTEEEEQTEKESAKSQDQYVLEKLFKKSGVHTALSHDAILSNRDPDYLLVEGEAERVAKEALKAVRASRARCFRPQLPSESKEQPQNKPRFGTKKSIVFSSSTESEVSKPKQEKEKKKEKKLHVFNGGMDDDDEEEDSEMKEAGMSFSPAKKQKSFGQGKSSSLSSSQLLLRMRQRNKGITIDSDGEDEDGYDPDYPSTATAEEEVTDPEIRENIDLLADIRNFVAFQAKVDGKASTQEIIERFKERLPAEQTPFFKALLMEICDFQRESSGEGTWILKGEFR